MRVVLRRANNVPLSGQQVQLRLDNVLVEQPAQLTDAQGSVSMGLSTTAIGEHSVTDSIVLNGVSVPVAATPMRSCRPTTPSRLPTRASILFKKSLCSRQAPSRLA